MKGQKFNAAAYNQQRNKAVETYDELLPSGFIFTLRRVDLSVYLANGQFPSNYLEKLLSLGSKSGQAIESTINEMTVSEKIANLQFLGSVIRAACVVPKIVERPANSEEIRFEDIADSDLIHIFQKTLDLGGEGENIAKFRQQ